MYCKQGLCMNVTDSGYCAEHGGAERQEREWAAQAARAEARTQAQGQKPKGQAVPNGKGLSRFTSWVTREGKTAAKRKKNADKEKARKALRGGAPKKKKDDNSDGKKGKGGGKDKNARKAAKDAAKGGFAPAPQPQPGKETFNEVVKTAEVVNLTQAFEPAPPGVVSTPVKE